MSFDQTKDLFKRWLIYGIGTMFSMALLLSILIVSVPPMAAMFFQGTLGSALTYSVFQGAGSKPRPQGQPDGSWGQRSNTPSTQQYGGRWKVAMKAESFLCAVSYLALLVGCAWLGSETRRCRRALGWQQ
ncbi:hypothetical protein [Luteibacter sp. dw_328]|uniref:hypothetical protein n=1 Tax=Luteibacter sp. dw_328 TaxID=2719796 RepID=UPI001BD37A7D|nr:hypothetical protein [Luteibacter sp. dw_328]